MPVKLLDTSYFYGDIYIPQKETDAVKVLLEEYINKFEFDFFSGLFGYEMGKAFYNALPTPPAGQYLDILNGKEFTDGLGRLQKFEGLKVEVIPPVVNVSPGRYRSIVANYIYFKFMRDNITQSTGTGEKVVEALNASDAHPWTKMSKAWNEMVNVNISLVRFLEANNTVYTKFSRYSIKRELVTLKNPLW